MLFCAKHNHEAQLSFHLTNIPSLCPVLAASGGKRLIALVISLGAGSSIPRYNHDWLCYGVDKLFRKRELCQTINCRQLKKTVDYNPRFDHNLALDSLFQLRPAVTLVPDSKLITMLVDRWRLETNTFHFYHGEPTVTLDDIHFLMGLSTDEAHVDVGAHIPSSLDDQTKFVERYLRERPVRNDLIGGS
ncbi:Protein MAIN-LIKE 2 [Linum perenne]